MVDRRQQVVIANYFYKSGESVSWVLNFLKDLLDHEIQDLVTLLTLLENVSLLIMKIGSCALQIPKVNFLSSHSMIRWLVSSLRYVVESIIGIS